MAAPPRTIAADQSQSQATGSTSNQSGLLNDVRELNDLEKLMSNCKRNDVYEHIHFTRLVNVDGTASNTLRCLKCEYETDDRMDIESHITIMHFPKENPYYCCRLGFITEHDYFKHRRTIHMYGYFCWFCGERQTSKEFLNNHFHAKHPNESFTLKRAVLHPYGSLNAQILKFAEPESLMAHQLRCQEIFVSLLRERGLSEINHTVIHYE